MDCPEATPLGALSIPSSIREMVARATSFMFIATPSSQSMTMLSTDNSVAAYDKAQVNVYIALFGGQLCGWQLCQGGKETVCKLLQM